MTILNIGNINIIIRFIKTLAISKLRGPMEIEYD